MLRFKQGTRQTESYEYRLIDKNGKEKQMFQLNALGQFLMKKGIITPYTSKRILSVFLLGRWSNKMRIANLVVDSGKAGVASRINGSGGEAAFAYIAIGTGTTAPAATDTALQSEITTGGGERKLATISRKTTAVTNDTASGVVTFDFTSSFSVTEAGLFNAATGGTMLSRNTFSAINVADGDSLQVTVDVQVQ